MINADGIDAVPGIGTGSVSLKHIARQAAHAAEREVMLLVLERTEWNRVRAAKLLEKYAEPFLQRHETFWTEVAGKRKAVWAKKQTRTKGGTKIARA